MESEAKRPRRLAFAAIIAAVLAVAALTGTLMGCAPSAPASDAGGSGTAAAPAEQEAGGDDTMAWPAGELDDGVRLRHLPYR